MKTAKDNGYIVETPEARWTCAALAVGLIVALISCIVFSAFRWVWLDEIFTLAVARAGTLEDFWRALREGPDSSPPLNDFLVRLSIRSLGESSLSVRLPAFLGLCLLIASLYVYWRQRGSTTLALFGTIVICLTPVFAYGYEGRPYTLWLGFTALAVPCWQTACDGGPWRKAALFGLAAAFAGAVSSHWFAPFALTPFAMAEGERTWRRHRVDWAVWIAFAVGLMPMLFYTSLIAALGEFKERFWARPTWTALYESYSLLGRRPAPLMATFAVLAIVAYYRRRIQRVAQGMSTARESRYPVHEVVLAAGFCAVPLIGFAAAVVLRGGFVSRYGMPLFVGAVMLLVMATQALGRHWPAVERVMSVAAIVNLAMVLAATASFSIPWVSKPALPGGYDKAPEGLPVVLSDCDRFCQLCYYKAGLPNRPLTYLVHGNRIENTGKLVMSKTARLIDFPIEEPDVFLAQHPHFSVIMERQSHVIDMLKERGVRLELVNSTNNARLYSATVSRAYRPNGGG